MSQSHHRKLSTDAGPLVVVDRCVLSFKRVETIIPPHAGIVLTDASFAEEATAKRPKGSEFNRWAKRFASRLFFARHWGDLSRMETEPGTFVHPKEIIHLEFSHELREVSKKSGLDWNLTAPGVAEHLARESETVRRFQSYCEAGSLALLERSPEWRKELSSPERQCELIRQPRLVAEFVQRENPRMSGPVWSEQLNRFPDGHAIGRIARLVEWYRLQYSLGKTRGFANNYFDADYALTASYVGRLATTDEGLIAATEAVFPYVEILSDPS